MGGRALQATPQDIDTTRDGDESGIKSPGLRLLDALRDGDDPGVLAVCGPTTTVAAANMTWSCRGREQIQVMLAEARERFPGLTFESRTRHVGFGLVIDEARVRDGGLLTGSDEPGSDDVGPEVDGEPDGPSLADHPMYDHPMHAELTTEDRTPTGRALTLWRDQGGDEPVAPLDLPVRVTVHHDDLQVHEVTLSFPAALLKRALGMHVDPFELSLSEVQSAFVAPAGTDLTTRTLARPELTLVPGAPDLAPPEPEVVDDDAGRRRWRWPVMLVVLALVAAGAWWAIQGRGSGPETATSPDRPTASASAQPSPSASVDPSPSARPSASRAPTVTQAAPSDTPSRKPNVTLRSDLAFGFNSARLSPEAKTAIDQVARHVVSAGLHGRIFVDGYTDSTGSAAYGVVLSQQRADTVSTYLQSRLLGAPVSIVSTGHGEAHPVTDNSTAAGRQANRRVTITLPRV